MRRLALVLMLICGSFFSGPLCSDAPLLAHTFAPSLLEVHEESDGVTVHFKQPQVRVAGSELRPLMPKSCQPTGDSETFAEGTGIVTQRRVSCSELVGQVISVEGIADSRADVLLRLELADGRSFHRVLTADRPTFEVPEEETAFDIGRLYGQLGVEHILSGFDHLLFVFGLVLLISSRRLLVWTVTAFTAGHSVTLALASLGVVSLPPGPTEVAIALSIFVLAVELTRRRTPSHPASPATSTAASAWRSPPAIAALFGLLHGLGFAGALTEIGLPEREIPSALLSFNIGIELGQLAFVAAVLIAAVPARRLLENARQPQLRNALALAPAYLIGTLSTFWVLERVTGMV